MMKKIIVFPFLLLSFGILSFLTLEHIKDHGYGHYRGALWADKAGYYSYLPFFITYNASAKALPDSIYEETGSGFSVEDGKLYTKYPLGVAMMEFPFFMAAQLHNKLTTENHAENAFKGIYILYTSLSAPLYVVLGLFLLYKSLLIFDKNPLKALLVVVFCLFGTSLFYYTVIEGLMSHSFSFALFCFLSYSWIRLTHSKGNNWLRVLLALSIGLIIVVRPFNLVLVPVYLLGLYFLTNPEKDKLIRESVKMLPWLLIILPFVVFPQLLYYKYAHGDWLVYSYGSEGFNFSEPRLLEVLVNPSSGLLVYVPAFLWFFVSLVYKTIKEPGRFAFLLISVVLISYIFASWHSWHFGCGLGIRPYVELVPLLMFPFMSFINTKSKPSVSATLLMMGLIIGYNIAITSRWTGCWFGKEDSFSEYFRMFW